MISFIQKRRRKKVVEESKECGWSEKKVGDGNDNGCVWIELILLKLKTENWKYCSKIIFKCVNSAVRPIFNEKIDKKWNLWVRKQCIYALFTIESQYLRLLFCTVHYRKSIFAVTVHWTVTTNVDFLLWTVYMCTVYGPTNFIFYQFFH